MARPANRRHNKGPLVRSIGSLFSVQHYGDSDGIKLLPLRHDLLLIQYRAKRDLFNE